MFNHRFWDTKEKIFRKKELKSLLTYKLEIREICSKCLECNQFYFY